MEIVNVYPETEQEKIMLLAFQDSLGYQYRIEIDDHFLTRNELQEIIQRKVDFLEGKTTSRPWNDVKKRYEKHKRF